MCFFNNSAEICESSDLLPMFCISANSYKSCFEECKNIEMNSEICKFIPMITNGNFAVELYLKFIKGYEQIQNEFNATFVIEKNHNIKRLFFKLNEKTQNCIIDLLGEKGFTKNEIINHIKANSRDFVNWRYPKKAMLNADIDFLSNLLNALYGYCKGIIEKMDMSRFKLDAISGYSIRNCEGI